MLVGPVFNREVVLAPRRPRIYLARTIYVAGLLIVATTAWAVLAGTQRVRDLGDLARFGTILFQILAPLQLGLATFFSAVLAASAVAQEKDRKTLILLLLTRLSNCELVLGKLMASLLGVLVMLLAGLPLFMLAALWGGVSFQQIGWALAVTVASAMACGSLGSTLALWREKTFQALAMTVLALSLWLAVWEIVAAGWLGPAWLGVSCRTWAVAFSPLEAIIEATRPHIQSASVLPGLGPLATPLNLFLAVAVAASLLLNGLAVVMVRIWNPSREVQPIQPEDEPDTTERATRVARPTATPVETSVDRATTGPVAATETDILATAGPPATSRRVWDNPIVWREIRTWAYGRKILLIKVAYLVLFALAASGVYWMAGADAAADHPSTAVALVPLLLLSLVLVNAQAVTSMTSERDGRALDLLLVTDLTPKEIVFGKLGGVFYNTKEMVLLPMALCAALCAGGSLSLESLVYLLGGLAVLYLFVAVLGIHAGMVYPNSQGAIATSLGTVFFLFVGVATCMWILVALGGSFQAQLIPFFVLIIVGGVGLYVALGVRNPSTAIGLASFLCPLATFYAITSYLLDYTLGVFLVAVAAYGFATAAMLVPAIYEFDVATGRTTAEG